MQRSFLGKPNRSGVPSILQIEAALALARQPSLFEVQYTEASRMRRAAQEAAIARIADGALATWGAVDACLSTTLGPKAVTALYYRSLYLTRIDHPWLVAAYEGGSSADVFQSLKNTVLRQTVDHANAALSALMHVFRRLLVGLLGEPLTERLLEPVGVLPFKAY